MIEGDTIDITSDAFARRLANLLADRRRLSGASRRSLARASEGNFTSHRLRLAEVGTASLTEHEIGLLAMLYEADLGAILPKRLPLQIRPFGVLSTSGISTSFIPDDTTSLLSSYLKLVRQLRCQQREPLIELRRDDVESIAEYLGEPGPSIVERLGGLMEATQLQRRAMAGMFVAGAVVIGLASTGVAAMSNTSDSPTTNDDAVATSTTTVAAPETTRAEAPTTSEAPATTTPLSPTTVIVDAGVPPLVPAAPTTAPPTTPITITSPAATSPVTNPRATPVGNNAPVGDPIGEAPATPLDATGVAPDTTAVATTATDTPPVPVAAEIPLAPSGPVLEIPVSDPAPTSTVDAPPPAPTTTVVFETGEPPLPPMGG